MFHFTNFIFQVETQQFKRSYKIVPFLLLQDNVRLSNKACSISACPSSMKCLVLRLHPGDDITDCLKKLMDDKSIPAACIVSCVGSVKCVELRMADSKTVSVDSRQWSSSHKDKWLTSCYLVTYWAQKDQLGCCFLSLSAFSLVHISNDIGQFFQQSIILMKQACFLAKRTTWSEF